MKKYYMLLLFTICCLFAIAQKKPQNDTKRKTYEELEQIIQELQFELKTCCNNDTACDGKLYSIKVENKLNIPVGVVLATKSVNSLSGQWVIPNTTLDINSGKYQFINDVKKGVYYICGSNYSHDVMEFTKRVELKGCNNIKVTINSHDSIIVQEYNQE